MNLRSELFKLENDILADRQRIADMNLKVNADETKKKAALVEAAVEGYWNTYFIDFIKKRIFQGPVHDHSLLIWFSQGNSSSPLNEEWEFAEALKRKAESQGLTAKIKHHLDAAAWSNGFFDVGTVLSVTVSWAMV